MIAVVGAGMSLAPNAEAREEDYTTGYARYRVTDSARGLARCERIASNGRAGRANEMVSFDVSFEDNGFFEDLSEGIKVLEQLNGQSMTASQLESFVMAHARPLQAINMYDTLMEQAANLRTEDAREEQE